MWLFISAWLLVGNGLNKNIINNYHSGLILNCLVHKIKFAFPT
jgi:hypothetical protein